MPSLLFYWKSGLALLIASIIDLSGLDVAVDPKLTGICFLGLDAVVLSDSAWVVARALGGAVVYIGLVILGPSGRFFLGFLFCCLLFGLTPVALLALDSVVGFSGHLVLPGMTFRGYRDGWAATAAN